MESASKILETDSRSQDLVFFSEEWSAMAEKGYTFVREAGVSPRDMKSTAHAKEAHVTIESDQDAYARRKLEERPNLLRQVFGIRYDEHPWYPEAIQKVLSGRDPYQVLLDYAERSPSSAEPVRASGW